MIRHLALAILLPVIASAPAAAATTILGNNAVGPAGWHSVTSKPSVGTTGSTGTGTQQTFPPFKQGTIGKQGTLDLHLECAFCTGHDGGVGRQPN